MLALFQHKFRHLSAVLLILTCVAAAVAHAEPKDDFAYLFVDNRSGERVSFRVTIDGTTVNQTLNAGKVAVVRVPSRSRNPEAVVSFRSDYRNFQGGEESVRVGAYRLSSNPTGFWDTANARPSGSGLVFWSDGQSLRCDHESNFDGNSSTPR